MKAVRRGVDFIKGSIRQDLVHTVYRTTINTKAV